ncbi:type II toxin-antitoxin system RelE/ParE family toxin [Serpentinicella alkaliphila]|uniref:Plasmid stabilization system protein ParE n=1 Tax=Serpentinicella alkaliphila TaxID=1734049 RepID=A0A4R2TF55_9FIRM|nr:type II toxin-antitoxin system RelE/ParE family toxin [Serpentinicella alkaliphila]QUH26179.1 type II toxin-antitoxin system RelE/ParE family toxin [Serpentinicella alkaliphila]TCP93342.1 plasmid stabilization system protein ParE [Serpentinicella alkaliphila]
MSNLFKIIYYPTATEDIIGILDYISIDDPPSAIKLVDKINESIGALSLFPYLGTVPRDFYLKSKGYRILITDSYIVFYLVDDSSQVIEIMRVVSYKTNYKTFL